MADLTLEKVFLALMLTFVEPVEVLIEAVADLELLQSFEELSEVKLATVIFGDCLGVQPMVPLLEAGLVD